MERDVIRLTPEQQKCADYSSSVAKDLVIQGIAGSGKSTVLMARAQAYLTNPSYYVPGRPNQVIIFTYNNTLATYLKEYIQEKFPVTSAHQTAYTITTLDSYLYDVFKYTPGRFSRNPLDDKFRKWMMGQALENHKKKYGSHRFHSIEVDFWIEECQWMMGMNISVEDESNYLVLPRAGRGGKVRMSASDRVVAFQIYKEYIDVLKEKHRCEFEEQHLYLSHHLDRIPDRYKYDYVLIDEAQDQSLTKMMIVAALCKKAVTISMDMNQRIYKQSWKLNQLGLKSVTKTLKTGFRCSPQNDALAESLRMHNPDADPDHGPAQGPDHGWKPLIKTLKNEAEQNRYFISTVQKWMKADPKCTIGVLYLTHKKGDIYAEWLTDKNIRFQKIESGEDFSAIAPGVKLSTIYSAKGLEFDHVILLDFNEGVIPNIKTTDPELMVEELVKYRNLAYVAITRAKGRLLICTHGTQSRFIKEMDSDLYDTIDPEEQRRKAAFTREVVEDKVTITAIIQETLKETKVTIDLLRFPQQKHIIGKKIGDTFKLANINLTYKIVSIESEVARTVAPATPATPARPKKAVVEQKAPTDVVVDMIETLNNFFEDGTLVKLFTEVYNYQCSISDDIVFVDRNTIVGFGRKGEHMRGYVGRAKDGTFFIKLKTMLEAIPFTRTNLLNIREQIHKNNTAFERDIDKFTLSDTAGTKTAQKTTGKTPAKKTTSAATPKPKSLIEFFKSKGLETVDLRGNNGCLWVLGDKTTLEPIVNEAIKLFGVYGAYGTGRALSYKPAWWTKSDK